MRPKGIKLDDEQVRRFICDGVVVLDSGVAPEVHQRIYDRIQWSNTHEFNMGNNVLPRVAELQQILDAPAVRGALQSVLGDGYLLHPHRFMHASEPLDEEERNLSPAGDEHRPPMGKGSTANSGWHRDGQIPLGRARYHVPRTALIFYFPQDTPVERGPTRGHSGHASAVLPAEKRLSVRLRSPGHQGGHLPCWWLLTSPMRGSATEPI